MPINIPSFDVLDQETAMIAETHLLGEPSSLSFSITGKGPETDKPSSTIRTSDATMADSQYAITIARLGLLNGATPLSRPRSLHMMTGDRAGKYKHGCRLSRQARLRTSSTNIATTPAASKSVKNAFAGEIAPAPRFSQNVGLIIRSTSVMTRIAIPIPR